MLAHANGSICELPDDGVLRAWTRGLVTFRSKAGAIESTTIREADGGVLVRLVVPKDTRELHATPASGGPSRVLALAPSSAPPWLAQAKAARAKGDVDGALEIARAHEKASEPVERALALGLLARIELGKGRPDASFPLFRESAELHRAAGRISDAADDSFALAFALNQRSHRYAEAREVLDGVHRWGTGYPEARARESYYRGTLALETGNARRAFLELQAARAEAARHGLGLLERNATNAYALQLELVGRVDEALEMLRALSAKVAGAPDASPCEKVEIAINLGYGELLANEQQRDEAGAKRHDPVNALTQALSAGTCKDEYLRRAALANLALAALQRNEPAVASERLREAKESAGAVRAVEVLFWNDLEGRIALVQKAAQRALAAFEEEARLASAMLAFEAEWRAAVGKAEALEMLGRNDAAIESYRFAEDRLTTVSFLVPFGEGRGSFVGDRSRSARLAVDLLVRLGRPKEALAIARSSRARIVQSLARSARVEGFDENARRRWEDALGAFRTARAALDAEAKDDWKLPRAEAARAQKGRERREQALRAALDEAYAIAAKTRDRSEPNLPPLPDAAVTLAFHPVRRGWAGFIATKGDVTSFALPSIPAEDDAAQTSSLIAPLRPHLAEARVVRVLSYGALREVDFHALSFDGEPLVAKVPVAYPLDLPAIDVPRTESAKPTALVISDPTLDLESARKENERVTAALRASNRWDLVVLEGKQASSVAVLPALARARLLHYAGHGLFGGRDGWQSVLPLAQGSHLAIGDVLASSAVPARVVLSGCETARSDPNSPSEALGLAQSFVVAGADFAIAPVRPVDDTLAARMSEALYGGLLESGEVDAPAALRAAQLAVMKGSEPTADWRAFRIVVR